MTEIFKPIPGFVGSYEVSNYYRVRSLDRIVMRRNGYPHRVHGRVLAPRIHRRSGLSRVTLATGKRGQVVEVYVHRLVREMFADKAAHR
ncbi:MAG: NUMOD4 domain-containing protein [Mycobacterium sp.]